VQGPAIRPGIQSSGIVQRSQGGKRSITADTALRLAKTFGTSEGFWLGLQADYDVEEARKIIAKDLAHVERIAAAHAATA